MPSEQDPMVDLPIAGTLTYREWHAFVNGFYVGYVDGERENRYDRERHYWRGGYLTGRASDWLTDRL
jgi:hypothetical protein